MLQLLRQLRRRLAGTFGLLVTGTWLAIAMAPCAASADMADMAMEEHCPHCDKAANPCADAMTDCDLPVSLAPVEPDTFKVLKLAALPATEATPDLPRATGPPGLMPRTVDPPHRPFQKLYCRYQE